MTLTDTAISPNGSIGAHATRPDQTVDRTAVIRDERDGPNYVELAVEGARCASCIKKIETGLSELPGVVGVRLNLTAGHLWVAWQGDALAPRRIIEELRALGYHATPFEPDREAEQQRTDERFLLRCLAVAGFAAANVMLLSIAVWSGEAEIGSATRGLLQWVSAAIALPAVAFSGRPFFVSAWRAVSVGRLNMDVPISLAVLMASGLSLFETTGGQGDVYFEAAVMLLFFLLIGRFLDIRLRGRTRSAAHHLASLQAQTACRLDEFGNAATVPARAILAGDRIVVGSGERIAVNATVEDGSSLIDTSLVTGETRPQAVSEGMAVYSGSLNLANSLILRASAGADDSFLAEVARMIAAGEQSRARYVRLADKAAALYVPLVHGLALATFVGWFVLGGAGLAPALVNAIAVLIITCPCALGLAVPAVQVVAVGRLFEQGALVKSGDALERLAEIDTAVLDKTGTLTEPTLRLAEPGDFTTGDLALAARLARASRHPLAQALARAAGTGGPLEANVKEHAGLGLEANIDNRWVRLGSREWCGQAESAASSGPELWLSVDRAAPVRFSFAEHLRPDAMDLIYGLDRRHVASEILSGDHASAVEAIAHKLGMDRWTAALKPADKVARLATLKAARRRALMVGDGLNDAPSLAAAHVSISPASAMDISRAAADIVLQGDRLTTVLEALDVARAARRRALENLSFAALYNAVAVPLAAAGLVTPLIAALAMSGSSLIVTLNALRLASRRKEP